MLFPLPVGFKTRRVSFFIFSRNHMVFPREFPNDVKISNANASQGQMPIVDNPGVAIATLLIRGKRINRTARRYSRCCLSKRSLTTMPLGFRNQPHDNESHTCILLSQHTHYSKPNISCILFINRSFLVYYDKRDSDIQNPVCIS